MRRSFFLLVGLLSLVLGAVAWLLPRPWGLTALLTQVVAAVGALPAVAVLMVSEGDPATAIWFTALVALTILGASSCTSSGSLPGARRTGAFGGSPVTQPNDFM